MRRGQGDGFIYYTCDFLKGHDGLNRGLFTQETLGGYWMSGPVVGTELMSSTCVLWEESSVISGYDDLWVQVWSEDTSSHGNGSVRESVSSCRADKNSLLEKVKLSVKVEGSEGALCVKGAGVQEQNQP